MAENEPPQVRHSPEDTEDYAVRQPTEPDVQATAYIPRVEPQPQQLPNGRVRVTLHEPSAPIGASPAELDAWHKEVQNAAMARDASTALEPKTSPLRKLVHRARRLLGPKRAA